MKILAHLSPAQTLIVTQPLQTTIKEVLKVTLMDLLLKQVIRTSEVERQSSYRDKIRYYKYIGIGKNYHGYQPLAHETIFLTPFQKSETVRILFRHMVKMGYQNAGSERRLHKMLIESDQIKNCFDVNIMQTIFGGFSVNETGYNLKLKAENEIAILEIQLPDLIKNDPPKALEILKEIKGNIFLLKNIDFELLQQIDHEFIREMNKPDDSSGTGCTGCTWGSFDNYSDSFDSSCSGDSGCSSGGCSGCSGCGGCGGCGGCS